MRTEWRIILGFLCSFKEHKCLYSCLSASQLVKPHGYPENPVGKKLFLKCSFMCGVLFQQGASANNRWLMCHVGRCIGFYDILCFLPSLFFSRCEKDKEEKRPAKRGVGYTCVLGVNCAVELSRNDIHWYIEYFRNLEDDIDMSSYCGSHVVRRTSL